MPNETVEIKTLIELVLAIVGIIGPLGATCFFAGKLSPRIGAVERREQVLFTETTASCGNLEKEMATFRGQLQGIRDEILDLRFILPIRKL